jgi:DNA-binding response OmpR family regulator
MGTRSNASIFKGLVFLLADGNIGSRALLRSMLLQIGAMAIYEADKGVIVLDVFRTISPDVMILDWALRDVSARSTLQMIRTPGVVRNSNVPIIVVSSAGQMNHVRDAISLGAQQFLVRPFSIRSLEQRLLAAMTVVQNPSTTSHRL